jgi:queuine tRNA-ribosyltransferase
MDRFTLVSARDGSRTLRDERAGETYHPELGIDGECTAWLDQDEITTALERTDHPCIWDVGLGLAGVACAALKRLSTKPSSTLVSFDRDTEALAKALTHADVFPHLQWLPPDVRSQRLDPGSLRVGATSWHLELGDAHHTLLNPALPAPDVVMYDMHSPRAQPELWTLDFWEHLHARLLPSSPCIAFHTRSTAVRATLLLAGFHVGTGRALGSKEETTLAAIQPDLLTRPLDGRWLERLQRSASSQPWLDLRGSSSPIAPECYERIRQHPQFEGPITAQTRGE